MRPDTGRNDEGKKGDAHDKSSAIMRCSGNKRGGSVGGKQRRESSARARWAGMRQDNGNANKRGSGLPPCPRSSKYSVYKYSA